jgi:hypothetical protein
MPDGPLAATRTLRYKEPTLGFRSEREARPD